MIKPWKFIARKHIFQHPRLQLAEDTVALPNGKEISYLREAPAKTHSVAIIAINADGHILLQKEYSYPPNTVLWQLPGGAIESGESIIDAARRELAEESGFTANSCTVIGSYYLNNRRSDRKQFVIVCRDLREETLPSDDEEFIESVWTDRAEITRMVAAGEIENITLLAALQLYDSFNNSAL
ncbi:NUDIX hydrolase [TM7 phylum sp. oral taxon 349]|jgi:hydrolase, NUDIX family|nr:NUDIX hydrolase [TM7 phylum sp. oral taxon 349]RKV94761.1 MAG: NUDIX hydrolase [Candidatus Saccharimonas sp.]